MKLYISKSIEEKASVRAQRVASAKDIDCWKADIISIKGKKVIAFLNEASSLVFFCSRPQERDFKHLADVFKEVLSKSFNAFGIPFSDDGAIEVYKGENKVAFERIKERLSLLYDYFSSDDRYLIYPSFLLSSRKVRGVSALDEYLSLREWKLKDISFLVKIRRADGSGELSLLIPSTFTLLSLKRCIDLIYSLSGDENYDFISYSNDSRFSTLKFYYRPEVFRALKNELDCSLKRKGCQYAKASSTMLSTLSPEYSTLVYRPDLNLDMRFFISFDSTMENLALKSPLILSIKWADDSQLNRALKEITS